MDSDYESSSNRTHGRAVTRKENEIWIPTRACISDYVKDAIDLLEVKGYNEIDLKAMGRAVEKSLKIAESIKGSIAGLHESTDMDSTCPVSNITITLSKKVLNDTETNSNYEWLSNSNNGREGTEKEIEIGIPTRACISDYVRYAIDLLEVKGYDEIVLKAMGRAVQNALEISKSVKESIAGIYESRYVDPVSIAIILSKKGSNITKLNYYESLSRSRRSRTHGRAGTRKGNEIGIPNGACVSDYVRDAIDLLEVKGYNEIVLKAMGRAVEKALKIAESVKRSIAGLHESRNMDSTCPVSNIVITLSKKDLNTSSRGYQCSGSGYGMKVKKEGSIFCLKNNASMKEIEEVEDCFILEFNPFEPIDLSKKLSQNDHHTASDEQDLSVIAERGQVACRDYPHSRHHCVKFPFDKTPHESYCEQCYCYVCDVIAPCNFWIQPEQGHCHASEQEFIWNILRTTKEFGALNCGDLCVGIGSRQAADSHPLGL
ncbi:uncharacterized protein LOC122665560 [Telopea speciosissima]|uniref:uncharacterized protein LOC122665560 n=1 Tax=Telopea speciosissima TaxID=54955 RepID=UPI001CC3F445|nr:uncharacterized protein LOC122665560 [Telopea speciosissima]